jgi:hypothetical protein
VELGTEVQSFDRFEVAIGGVVAGTGLGSVIEVNLSAQSDSPGTDGVDLVSLSTDCGKLARSRPESRSAASASSPDAPIM